MQLQKLKNSVIAQYEEQEADDDKLKNVKEILDKLVKEEVRRLITEEKVRPDGRKPDEIRPLSSEVGYYHVHMDQDYLHVDKLKPFRFVH